MRTHPARRLLQAAACLCALSGVAASAAAGPESAVEAAIRSRIEPLIEHLDSALYAQTATWREHLVLTYRRAAGRPPTPIEAAVLTGLHERIGLPRSAVLAFALRGAEPRLSWDRIRRFARSTAPEDFVPGPGIAQEAAGLERPAPARVLQRLRPGPGQALRPAEPRTGQAAEPDPPRDYSIYYGYLHAHSALSDGEGDPLEAYEVARDNAGLDFFALTDHGELMALWPWQRRWEQLVAAADAANRPGSFAALWGFEWSNPLLGHLNVLGTADFTDALRTFSLLDLYDWISARPAAVARLNHPGDYDLLRLEFLHFLPYPRVRPQIVGIETWNGNGDLDSYFYPAGYRGRFRRLDEANRWGWRLGALGGQDNHEKDWGTKNELRTAVLATELSREAIIEAFRARRFYATEDRDLELRFRSGDHPMGSRLRAVVRELRVEACDGSGDRFREVRLYRNGRLLEEREVDGVCIEADFTDTRFWPSYYYVVVRQADDHNGDGRPDEAVSSPIWFGWR